MNCVRRPAGAHTPASQTSACSRRPDAGAVRSRARLILLPAFALLFGAISLFGTATAQAQQDPPLCSDSQIKQLSPAGGREGKFESFSTWGSHIVNEGTALAVRVMLSEALTPHCELSIPLEVRLPGHYQGKPIRFAAEPVEDIELPLAPIVIEAGSKVGTSTIRTKHDADADDELFYVVIKDEIDVGRSPAQVGVEIRGRRIS